MVQPKINQESSSEKRDTAISFAQCNLGRGFAATQEFLKECSERRVSVALLQEPYVGASGTFTTSYNSYCMQSHRTKPVKSAIVVLDPNLSVVAKTSLISENLVCILLCMNNFNLGVASVYWEGTEELKPYLKHLERMITGLGADHIIIGGDCNAKSPWWGCRLEDDRGMLLSTFLAQYNLEVANSGSVATFSTARGEITCESIVDVTIHSANLLGKVIDWKVDIDMVTLSDHRAITFTLAATNQLSHQRKPSTRIYNTKKADWVKFRRTLNHQLIENDINELTFERIHSKDDLDLSLEKYMECIKIACNESIPRINQKKAKRIYWWNPRLSTLKAQILRLRNKIRKANPRRKPFIIKEYNDTREEYKTAIVSAKRDSWKSFCAKQNKESLWDRMYRVLKFSGNHSAEVLLKNNNDEELSGLQSAELLATTFYPLDDISSEETKHKKIRERVDAYLKKIERDVTKDEPLLFTNEEISQVLKNMNPSKAPGYDGFTSDVCTEVHSTNPMTLRALYNSCMRLGYFPRAWKRATVITLRKPGKEDYSRPNAYRPIGLLPVLGKVLEKMLCSRLLWNLGRENKLSPRQYGFFPQRGTEDALYDAISMIRDELNKKRIVALVSLDIEGAFDNAWWPKILDCMIRMDCDQATIKILSSYLSDRRVTLSYAGHSVTRDTNKGCIQGSTGGPLMWNLLMNPLLHRAENFQAHVQAFADDILVIASAKDTDDLNNKVNTTLARISEWGSENKLRFATHKTQVLIVTKKYKLVAPIFRFNGCDLSVSDHLTILGVTLDSSLNFRKHLDNVYAKTIKRYQMVARAAKATWGLCPEILYTLYQAIVEPTVLYAASVWSPILEKKYAIKTLNKIARLFAIKISKSHRTVSLNASILLARILPLDLRAKEAAEAYLIKRGKPIIGSSGGWVEKQISPFQLPHPAKRRSVRHNCIETQINLNEIEFKELSIYTDGSKIKGKVGGATSVWINGVETHNHTFRLGDKCSVFQAELVALLRACRLLTRRPYSGKSADIFSDSRSALQAIEDPISLHPIVVEIKNAIHNLESLGGQVKFYWVRAHTGIKGNERADELAKFAALQDKTAPIYDAIPAQTAKWLLRQRSIELWQERYSGEKTGAITKLFFPDVRLAHHTLKKLKNDNIMAQIFTGHGGFGEYLHKYGYRDDPACDCDDNSNENIIHILCECPKFIISRYDLEMSIGINITSGNIKFIMREDGARGEFLKYARKITMLNNRKNNSKVLTT